MNALEAALIEISEFLTEQSVPYMVIGGFANLYWGRSRLTEDLDVTVKVEESAWPAFVEQVTRRFRTIIEDPLTFVRDRGVLPVVTAGGIRVDLVFDGNPPVSHAIDRAVSTVVGGVVVRICTAEDLILHKIVSDRPRDREDVEGIVLRQGRLLDRSYLDPLVDQLAHALERPEISTFYRECLRKVDITSTGSGGTPASERPRG